VKGACSWRGLHPQPLLPLENVDPPPKTWVVLKKCSFCGLRFSLAWVAWFASCKHVYHDWCVMYHFGTSIKCIQRGCEEEMHKSWCSATRFKKLGSSTLVKDESKCTMKVEQPWARHRGAPMSPFHSMHYVLDFNPSCIWKSCSFV
jgi:hypothetical protein